MITEKQLENYKSCVNQVYNYICNGKRRITVFVPAGGGKTLLSILLSEKICSPYQRALIVTDNKALSDSCNDYIKEYGAKSIQSITLDDLIKQETVADLYILQLLSPALRNRFKNYLGKRNPSIVISIGQSKLLNESKLFSNPDKPIKLSNHVEYHLNVNGIDVVIDRTFEQKSKEELVRYYARYLYRNPVVYATEDIVDIRDIASADTDEKEEILSEVKENYNTLSSDLSLLNDHQDLFDKEDYQDIIQMLSVRCNYCMQLITSCGIPRNVLEEELKALDDLRIQLKTQIKESNGELDESVISEFETAVTESIVKLSKSIHTSVNQERYEDILKELLTEDVWENKLSEQTKTYLITARIHYDTMTNMPNKENLDYSGVCLLVTKALDVEMTQRLYLNYVEYLKKKYPPLNYYSKWSNALLNKEQTGVKEQKDFTLGTITYVVGVDSNGIIKNLYSYNLFKEYAKSELYRKNISDSQQEEKIKELVQCVEKIRKDYRNPAAHRNSLSYVTAEACMDYMIDTEKKLKEILKDMES